MAWHGMSKMFEFVGHEYRDETGCQYYRCYLRRRFQTNDIRILSENLGQDKQQKNLHDGVHGATSKMQQIDRCNLIRVCGVVAHESLR